MSQRSWAAPPAVERRRSGWTQARKVRSRAAQSSEPVVALRLFLHRLEARVVVGKLVQMCERDLAGCRRVIAGHVGPRVVTSMLELDVEVRPKLLEVVRR